LPEFKEKMLETVMERKGTFSLGTRRSIITFDELTVLVEVSGLLRRGREASLKGGYLTLRVGRHHQLALT